MEKKIKLIQKVLKDYEMLLIDNPQEVYDILNLKVSMNMGEYDASMLIGRKKAYVICDQLLYSSISKTKGVIAIKADSYEYLKNNRLFLKEWKSVLSENKITKLGLTNMSLDGIFKEVFTFHFISPSKTLGRIKEESEITKIKTLAKKMKKLFEFAENSLEEGMSDVRLRNLIDEEIYSLSCDRRYLPTYIGFDAKSIYPTLSGEKLKSGSIVLIDAGIMNEGMGLSFSSSIKFKGLSKEKEKIFRTAKDGLDVILSFVNENSTPSDADFAFREYLARHRMKDNSLEYAVSFFAPAETGEINSVTEKSRFAAGQIVKATSSVFIPNTSGARFEAIVLIKGKSNEKIM
ncbi:MAG: M24 family metallopeptidase [bacterium]